MQIGNPLLRQRLQVWYLREERDEVPKQHFPGQHWGRARVRSNQRSVQPVAPSPSSCPDSSSQVYTALPKLAPVHMRESAGQPSRASGKEVGALSPRLASYDGREMHKTIRPSVARKRSAPIAAAHRDPRDLPNLSARGHIHLRSTAQLRTHVKGFPWAKHRYPTRCPHVSQDPAP